jgi:hypothetical protein
VRVYGPWIDLNEAFRRGLAQDGVFELEPDHEQENGYVVLFRTYIVDFLRIYRDTSDKLHDTYIKLYRSTLALVPNFKKSLEDFGDDFESIMDLINLVSYILVSEHSY